MFQSLLSQGISLLGETLELLGDLIEDEFQSLLSQGISLLRFPVAAGEIDSIVSIPS